MRLWRISDFADLSGAGGLRYSARWHTAGRPVLYAAEHPAAALAEMLVHIARDDLPDLFQLLTIEIDESTSLETVALGALSDDWTMNVNATRAVGDDWLASGRSLALRVPSALVPDAWNVLLNPSHPQAMQMRIAKVGRVPLDARFK